jgi:hypothetical protein
MTTPDREALRRELEEAADLIRSATGITPTAPGLPAPPLQGLLAQLLDQRDQAAIQSPVRLFKHFACSGGTVMSKCLAAMPNAVVLSEMDPLSRNKSVGFAPADLVKQMHDSRHVVSDELAIRVFLAGLNVLQETLTSEGQRLILREHSHSQYCTAAAWDQRPSLEEIVAREHPVQALLSVRHPMSSFLSLRKNGWVQFAPNTLEEYARRYLAFLDDNANCPIVFYEDFVDSPEEVLETMCRSLDLPYAAGSTALVGAIGMSGDSGRSGDEITARPPREVPADLAEASETSAAYGELCKRLRYPLLPG